MLGLFDSHAHLNDRQLRQDVDEILARAAADGMERVICPGFDIESSRSAVEIAEKYENVWATVGVHPHDAKTLSEASLDELKEIARSPKVVGIGEIGLDFYRDLSPRPVQEEAFRKQLALARELDLPVVIHNRDAGADVLRVLGEEGLPAAGGVLHCYSENVEYAMKSLELGLYIGIAGPVTFRKNEELREVVRQAPDERLLIETDAPYLTPEPFRGRRRNEPALVRLVAEKVAEVKGTDLASVAQSTAENTLRLFSRI